MVRSTLAVGAVMALLTVGGAGSPVSAKDYTITVYGDVKQGDVPHFWSRCCGTGGAQLCNVPEWKVAAKLGVEEAGFMAYRGHRILSHSNPLIWNGGGTPTFNWAEFDKIYDFLVDTLGTVPIVELSAQPKALETSGEWSPPKDLNVYRQMIEALVRHCNERYGQERVRKWYWEVWNEWDYSGFWSNGNEQQYYAMYKAAVEGATAADPEVKIGGPSSTGAHRLANFLNYCKSNNVQVDFVSNHCYGGGGSGPNADAEQVMADNRSRSDAIKSFGRPLGSMNTEYNSSYSGQGGKSTSANCISMDSHVNAPYVAKCVKLILDDYTGNRYQVPDAFSYWAISDVFDEYGREGYIKDNGLVPFGEVFGLINYQGIPKATFNAFRLLHKMGTTRLGLNGITSTIADGVDGFATVNEDSTEVAVLLYNFFKALAGHTASDNINLTVNNLPFPNGKVEVSHIRIDSTHSNAYGAWLKMGKKRTPTSAEWDEMRKASDLAVVKKDTIEYSGSGYEETFSLPEQGISFWMFRGLESTAAESGTLERFKPAVHFSGTKLINNRSQISLSFFSVDGKRLKTVVTDKSAIELRNIAGIRGVCLVRIESEGKLLTSKFVRMD